MSASTPQATTSDPRALEGKESPGRGAAIVIYGLYLGAIMSIVTLPLGAAIAHYRLGRGAAWVDSHLRFQIRTFWIMAASSVLAVGLWQLLGVLATPPMTAWAFGYLYITAMLMWFVARCAVGVHRITSHKPIDHPGSLLFG